MKKIYLSLILALGSTMLVNAQNVNIPDANFKSYLVGNTNINTNSDAEIQVNEASAFTGTIDCSGMSITDLTGIEAFTTLTKLYCSFNQLTSLDVSANTALTDLRCNHNQLTALNFSANTALTDLRCNNNQLITLDVAANAALETFDCGTNQLTALNVSANTALEFLNCDYNQLTTLNVSANTALTILMCQLNQLTSLDVSANTDLINLICRNNQLTTLDLSANTALSFLGCSGNQLTSLDVSANTVLNYLWCNNNQLTTLNVKNGNNSNFSNLNFDARNNPNLICIQVDNVAYSTSNWTQIDATASFSENCSTGINENFLSLATSVYPKPTKGQIYFSGKTNVHLTNVTGQIIMDRKNVNTLDLSDQPTGIYFLICTNNNGQVTERSKIVKE